jgi:Cytochrome c554 and c-prime
MRRSASVGLGQLGIFVIATTSILASAFLLGPIVRADDAAAAGGNKKIAQLIALGHKFLGSTSCKSCHGNAAADPGSPIAEGSELTVWSTNDKHHNSFSVLSNDVSKGIATKGGYGDPTTSDKCLSCHSLDVPDASRGPDFKLAEGVTCEACHGPAELWSGSDGSPHKDKGWAEKRRGADGYDPKVAAQTDGLWDVHLPGLRAENCASCHLAIDAKMVAAGHPQPAFELNEYASWEPKHWTDKRGDQYYTQLWVAGQLVCARDAMAQLSDRAANGADAASLLSAYNQAMAHATMVDIIASTDGGIGSEVKADLETAMTTLQATKGADASKIKDAAATVSGDCDKIFQADLSGFAPDVTCTGNLLDKVTAASDDMMKNFDRRGAEQAAYAARWLYLSKCWDSDTNHELPDDLVAEYKGFFDNRAGPLGDDAAKFADAISKIKANP